MSELDYWGRKLLSEGKPVDTGHWQSLKDVPQTKTFELAPVVFTLDLPQSMQELQDVTQCNLPWAEEQFQERVGGVPLNPGESYKKWPWYRGNVPTHHHIVEPEVDERDWAYLAALIDGDGSISVHSASEKKDRARIHIGQKEGEYLRAVVDKFHGLGRLRQRQTESKCGNFMWDWCISNKADLKWCLPKLIPYLILKREKAEIVLEWVNSLPDHGHDKPLGQVGDPRFSHSYMERLWPDKGHGIRFPQGNLNDAISLLAREPYTRQCYVPIWYAEDLAAANRFHERVPCTLGYHFLLRDEKLHCNYFIRSCDYLRHFRDDVYLAGRLCQWMVEQLGPKQGENRPASWEGVVPGTLTMFISSLHVFEGDLSKMRREYG